MKQFFLYFTVFILLLLGCAAREIIVLPSVADYELNTGADDIRHLRIGFVPGPYGDMFMEAVYPFLSEMGYTAEFIHYDDYNLPNYALSRNQIDLNMFQHYRFLVHYKFENDMSLSAIAETPTVPMGIYSLRFNSLSNLRRGITVSVPEDITNYARALLVLEDAGIIRLSRSVDRSKVTRNDIADNPYNIQIVPLRAQNLVHSLTICDLSVIDGNLAISGGLNPSDALFTEWLVTEYFNVIAVRTEDMGKPFATDILKVLRSDRYREIITDTNGEFFEFSRPFNFDQDFN